MENIRNIAVMGHGKCGKTTLTEAMLFNAGETKRLGSVADGTTVTDYDSEEIKRKFSINTAVAPLNWKGMKYNVIDTPGYFDFAGDVKAGVRAADSALVVLSGRSGVSVGTEQVYKYAKTKDIPIMFFVNKIDDNRASYEKTLEEMKAVFGKAVTPFVYPIREGDEFKGFVDIVDMTARRYEGKERVDIPVPEGMAEVVAPLREMIMEAVASTDEELMVKYFNEEEFTFDEIKQAIRKGVKDGSIYPVYCGSGQDNIGVRSLMDGIGKYLPSPSEIKEVGRKRDNAEPVELVQSETETTAAVVFKTIADPYVGKMSIFRVYSGEIKADSTYYNPNKGESERIGKVYTLCGKKQTEVKSVKAGDIGCVTKLEFTKTGDTLCDKNKDIILTGIEFPPPVLSMAVKPAAKGDEEKIISGLTKLMDEDPTFTVTNNAETKQTLINGQGEQHIDVIVSKLKNKYGVNVILEEPITPYRETITKTAVVEGKHKKQSGGHGQYGHVKIEFSPGLTEELMFEEKVFGGSVPKNYFPAIEKGLQESCAKGVLAGYPVVNLKATLLDGSYHPVDSSEMAFKTAASIAYKEGLKQAGPVILEPIGYLKSYVPENIMGDVIGDINKRRGRIMGMGESDKEGLNLVEAEVPMSEMHKYATDLRAMSGGRGTFTFEFVRYEQAPMDVANKIIASSKD
ncbi:MAG TPA: elongation factor G [Candidatus Ornithomonoglobus merdipullorum]|uniref:Elongation factor G n=1 Tax=Candidatus Ornithomonoglobus merdipullorum TaxID=2840895 RepID=A0A9D1MBP8_9FIRM|nr:elongation factor G [Candidatus Ornithomonoglobus merdipullorum]